MVHGSTAYFSSHHNVYSYTVPENKWTKLPQCKYEYFAMAVTNDALTAIGGRDNQHATTNTLLTLSGSSWEEVLPSMPTKRVYPAAANTPTHLVVAGGRLSHSGDFVATVEVLNTETLHWSTASSLPETVGYPQMTICGGYIYAGSDDVFSCSVENLLKSCGGDFVRTILATVLKFTNLSDGGSVWTKLARVPTPLRSSLATLRGHVLAIGGEDAQFGGNLTGAIHCYDEATNSWSVIGVMPTPRCEILTAVLPSNELVVVGGLVSYFTTTTTTEIGICQ